MANPFQNKSDRYWIEGEACAEVGCWNSAAHILYYAVFQAVYGFAVQSGHLATYMRPYIDPVNHKERTPSKHDAVRKIVKRWRGDLGFQALRGLYSARIIADYDTDDAIEQQVKPHIQDAQAIREYFINLRV